MGFSFNYDGKRLHFTDDGEYKIDENLTVVSKRTDFSKFDAFYRVIWFENTGKSNSKIISDILDCDAVIFAFKGSFINLYLLSVGFKTC